MRTYTTARAAQALVLAVALMQWSCSGDDSDTPDRGDAGEKPDTGVAPDSGTNEPDAGPALRSLGGAISNLKGSGLVLANGSEELAVDANATQYVFANKLEQGAGYEVSVKTNPSDPTQTCSVANASGTAGDSDVTNADVSCVTNKYTISATVNGLVADGLVLQNNGGDDLTVTPPEGGSGAAKTVTFATAVESGAEYAVTIKTQPSTQTCQLSGATGKVVAGDITTVTVNCTDNTYMIGGTVSGLAGSGLELRDGVATDESKATVNANGEFAFPTARKSGVSYAVSVERQPSSPSQTCSVTSGSGTVGSQNVSSITLACVTNQYSIGATVSGLVGAGLVLQNNAGDDKSVSANGAVTFGTKVASGSAYAITVLTQPQSPSQNCTVANGTGTVGDADVTAPTVTCTVNKYPVGGTVTGLEGDGLTLQNNGGDNLVVTASPFAFAMTLESGASYAVTISAQPTDPWQTCAVSNGSGSVGNGPVTTVSVACATNEYSVKASVSGLLGSGLILQNNAGNDLSVSGNTTHTFTNKVDSGEAYAVTVLAQPINPSQTCMVTQGSGTIAGADVTAQVTCVTNKYSVGGTVSGFAGSGLQLLNDGVDALLVSGPNFTFAMSVESNEQYDVSVSAQPTNPWQTCTVSNGSGTVTNANITDVSIACVTNTYQVGAQVAGLEGTGLTLQNGGADDLSVSADGTVYFDTEQASGQMYAVTVSEQPTSPWQTCTVSSGTGTVTNSDVTSPQVTCVTQQYTLGVSVTGLTTGTLVLQNNGADDLTITADGTYNFATEVESGAMYSVAPSTQPVGQTCVVASGSGTVANADVTLTVTCRPIQIQKFSYTGSTQIFTVPAGVTQVTIEAYGAQGGNNAMGIVGGKGAKVTGKLSVTPGDVLAIRVGGMPGTSAGGWNGGGDAGAQPCASAVAGGGGGASDVRRNAVALTSRVIVAAGGGGAAGSRIQGCGRGSGGGGGGGYYGGGGGAGWPTDTGGELPSGGSQSAGGLGGTSAWSSTNNGFNGVLGVGGNGGPEVSSGQTGSNVAAVGGEGRIATGGPGLYSGNWTGQSGAGGSSYLGGVTSASGDPGVREGHGEVTLSW